MALPAHQLLSEVERGSAEGRPVPRPAAAEDADRSHRPPSAAAAAAAAAAALLSKLLLVLLHGSQTTRGRKERMRHQEERWWIFPYGVPSMADGWVPIYAHEIEHFACNNYISRQPKIISR
jgi:hypothetical protein